MPEITRDVRSGSPESGFGMIEIVVSMFLIAILAMAFLPMLMQGLTVSRTNATVAAATQLVRQQLEKARAVEPTCAVIAAFGAEAVPAVTDARDVSLQPRREVGPCSTSGPTTVSVRAWVTEAGSATVLADATTLIFVGRTP